MDREIEIFLKRLSLAAITVASFTILFLFLQTPDTCISPDAPLKPHLRFPKSTCDFLLTRPHLPTDKKNNRLWSTRLWNQTLHSFTLFFSPLIHHGLLRNHSKVLCVSAGAGHEVMAINNLGVEDVTGVELMDSPPLVSRADPHNLPFFDAAFDFAFTARFDEALFPSRFAAEMERTVRPGGVCLVLVEECGDGEVKDVVSLFTNSKFFESRNVTLNGMRMTSILLRTIRSPPPRY